MKSTFRVAAAAVLVAASSGLAFAQAAPQLRDTRTGKVWTPEITDEEASAPSSYADKAFDPRTQAVVPGGTTVQHPRATLMGTVPMTAGPNVPVLTLDVPSLQVLPGRYWLSILYLTNNSASTVDAVVGCHFTNHGQTVQNTQVIVPPAGPGERLGVPVRGPRFDVFVDQVTCAVTAPT
ncbi:hypothetical protein SAMN02745126_05878 [Enhydrobacter aerosaccus]|uniref:Uncharacterized protein n=1 Tax=Enhydrobacter aerosaccus TaxID=225324 RepID=A0A1T4T915_9HYPH|nr:hypothetical protein [Enhydrobacter aerosaccus]SKA37070.1 hypothetical protein SAMN02745126_05878 [Enhydrobacter aerosaccus]